MVKASATIKPQEAAHFSGLAADWWNPHGSSAMLHKLNPVRLAFIRAAINAHFRCDAKELMPLRGRSVLDAGCGAGLLCEPLARLGGNILGLDAAKKNIEVAQVHAAQSGLDIEYQAGELAQVRGQFDMVTCLEVLEHVQNPQVFMGQLADRLAKGGLMIISTPNRTALAKLLLVDAAEALGHVPKGTHDWSAFLTPQEARLQLEAVGLRILSTKGVYFTPAKGLHLSDTLALNYMFALSW
jgi:2-polyprenyl-6-hydroxyphenyl methylase / 3-demethylubiquinone-9 3-methyltransferase